MQEKILKNALHLGEAIIDPPLSGEEILKRTKEKIRAELIAELFEQLTPAQILYTSNKKLLQPKVANSLKKYNFSSDKNTDEINERVNKVVEFLIKHSSLVGKE